MTITKYLPDLPNQPVLSRNRSILRQVRSPKYGNNFFFIWHIAWFFSS